VPRYGDSASSSKRSSIFERIGDRGQVSSSRPSLLERSYDYYVAHRTYYDGFFYRPHAGWRPPHYQGGFYYYSWPRVIEPCHYGYYVFSYVPDYAFPSIYFYYGYFPYILRSRVIVVNVPAVTYVEVPVKVRYRCDDGDDYYLSAPRPGTIEYVLRDIRDAWLRGDFDLIEKYIDPDHQIDVYIDGHYSYTVEASDYASMTRDALDRIETIDLDFYSVTRSKDDRYSAYGEHTYKTPDGNKKKVYVSYTLQKRHGTWVITEVGSSSSRL